MIEEEYFEEMFNFSEGLTQEALEELAVESAVTDIEIHNLLGGCNV